MSEHKLLAHYCPDGQLLTPEAYGYPASKGRHYEEHQEAHKEDEQHEE